MRRTTVAAVPAAAVALMLLTTGPASADGHEHEHDHPSPTPAPTASLEDPGSGHAGHGSAPEVTTDGSAGVSDGTRTAVLGGFGLVNAAVLGSALVIRRRSPARTRRIAGR